MPSQSPLPPSQVSPPVETMLDGSRDGGQHELASIDPPKPALPIEEDLMGLARLGELRGIQKLFDSGKYNPNSADEQGITALHWAAINGHHALCHFLLQSGADPNVRGGDALATPVLWASKKCQLDIVNLLLQNGADPLITDDAGYNLLHCATLDGNVFQLILLLHQPGVPVDVADSQGHTSLMWAAYKGYPACVDILLRWGASVNIKDDMGFTALHWALVRGNTPCIQKLVEYGADRSASNNEGKTPAVTAKEMNSSRQWHAALQANGFDKDGNPREFPVPMVEDKRKFFWRFFYALPFFVLWFALWSASSFPIFIGLPGALIGSYIVQWFALRLFKWAPSQINHVRKTPYWAGLFSASLFWVGFSFITSILPYTYSPAPVLTLLFLLGLFATTYFYFNTMLSDPGFVPKSSSRSATKSVIDELVSTSTFDDRHFCSTCVIRRPLRSKHCNRCGRCIAREDHHCPWAATCIGINNHRSFVLYMLSLVVSIILLLRLFLLSLPLRPSPPPGADKTCTLLSPELCGQFLRAPFTALLCAWAALQLLWVSMLLLVQFSQVARALTTYEAMRGHRVGAVTSALTTGSTDPAAAAGAATPSGPPGAATPSSPAPGTAATLAPGLAHAHPRPKADKGCWPTWKRLLGLDTVLATAMYGSRAADERRQRPRNPYSAGLVRNCADFWVDEAGCVSGLLARKRDGTGRLGGRTVDYMRLYTLPDGAGMRYTSSGGYESVGGDIV